MSELPKDKVFCPCCPDHGESIIHLNIRSSQTLSGTCQKCKAICTLNRKNESLTVVPVNGKPFVL